MLGQPLASTPVRSVRCQTCLLASHIASKSAIASALATLSDAARGGQEAGCLQLRSRDSGGQDRWRVAVQGLAAVGWRRSLCQLSVI
jgi:hypothetical protein